MYDKGKEAVVYFSMSIKLYLNFAICNYIYVAVCSYAHSTECTWVKNKLHMSLNTIPFCNDVSFTIS